MFAKFSECISLTDVMPPIVLNLWSELMRFYPAFLKGSMLLGRLIQ